MSRARAASPESALERILEVDGRAILVRARRHRRARRITLRVDAREDCAVLTLPARASLESGFGFARERAGWLARKLAALPPLTPFDDHEVIPFRGARLLIRHLPLAGPDPVLMGGVLQVPGDAAGLAARVKDWLRGEALGALTRAATQKAASIGRTPPPISVRDPRARWGSCSAKGRLSFSWRLIMAPPMVLDYVAAHEVAHLLHLDHGAEFKATLSRLAARQAEARDWLAREGSGLHRYG
ncbi:MAG: SprT family zinc-dependent metalloprotease [Alphaproteobacteria bacterium]